MSPIQVYSQSGTTLYLYTYNNDYRALYCLANDQVVLGGYSWFMMVVSLNAGTSGQYDKRAQEYRVVIEAIF